MLSWLFGRKKAERETRAMLWAAVSESQNRDLIEGAMRSINRDDVLGFHISQEFAARAASALIGRICAVLNLNPAHDDDDYFVVAFAVLVFADHYSRMLGTDLEMTGALAFADIARSRDAKSVMDEFLIMTGQVNKSVEQSNPLVPRIGQACAEWTRDPTAQRLAVVAALLKIARRNVSHP